MKSLLVIYLGCCFLFTGSGWQQHAQSTDTTQVSPDFSFITLDGQNILSSNLKGKVIVLDFWSTDCTPCRKSMPQLEEFYQRYKHNPKVAIYLVNSGWEPIEKAKAFATSKRSSFLFFSWGTTYDLPFAYDNSSVTLKAFGFDANPSTVIIDGQSRIRVKHSGYVEKLNDFLSQQVELYLAER
jgi:thiol-disulfide isomerase/thioredoxin